MSIESLISALVRQELCGHGREKEALHFHLDLNLAHHSNNRSYGERHGLHLLYHVNPGYTYITVFSSITESPFTKVKDVREWKHEITHDSCWSAIDVFSRVYFDMAAKINAKLKQNGEDEVAPIEMLEINRFAIFGPAFDWVPVEITKDPQDERSYRKLVKVL